MLLKLKDYERIYKVVNSVVKNEGADPSICCIFFSAYGACILSKHYNLNAVPKAGLAAYHIGGNNDALVFGEKHQGYFSGEGEAFHCWVEVDGWVIDFMAPAFSELNGGKKSIPSKMLQKPLTEMAASVHELRKTGDFYLESTTKSTEKHLKILSTSMAYGDLANLCVQWFKKYPKKMPKTIIIGDNKGNQNSVSLTGNSIAGEW